MITIAELRARNDKMSQAKLAKEISVGVDSIRRWEKDIFSANSKSITALALYFNVSTDDLLGMKDKKISI